MSASSSRGSRGTKKPSLLSHPLRTRATQEIPNPIDPYFVTPSRKRKPGEKTSLNEEVEPTPSSSEAVPIATEAVEPAFLDVDAPTLPGMYGSPSISPLEEERIEEWPRSHNSPPPAGIPSMPDDEITDLMRPAEDEESEPIQPLVRKDVDEELFDAYSIEPLQEISGAIPMNERTMLPVGLTRSEQKDIHIVSLRDDCNPVEYSSLSGVFELPGIPEQHQALLAERRQKAVKFGSQFIRKEYLQAFESKVLTSNDRRRYKKVLSLLDTCLLNWRIASTRIEDREIKYYSLLRDNLYNLLKALREIRDNAITDFQTAGKKAPFMPQWGPYGSPENWWSWNDAECVAATFRVDTERFLYMILEHHQVGWKSPKGKEKEVDAASETTMRGLPKNRIPTESVSLTLEAQNTQWRNLQGRTRDFLKPPTISAAAATNSKRFAEEFASSKAPFQRDTPPHQRSQDTEPSRDQRRNPARRDSPPSDNGPDSSGEEHRSQQSQPPKRQEKPKSSRRPGKGGGPPSEPSDGSGDDKRKRGFPPRVPRSIRSDEVPSRISREDPRFDVKLKPDTIPTWDGDMDNIINWETQINSLAKRSATIYTQLGYLVPGRLRRDANLWYYSQSERRRDQLEEDWGTLKAGINAYYMNQTWMDDQMAIANNTHFRDSNHATESPSQYFIRKKDLLTRVYQYTDTQLIRQIMLGAPTSWTNIVTPHLYADLDEFQGVIRFHESNLIRVTPRNWRQPEGIQSNSYLRQGQNAYNRRVNLVGSSPNLPPPQFPRDDTIVSKLKRGTPEENNARPCRHCGSPKHWDFECKHSRKGMRRVRTNNVMTSPEEIQAQREYEDLYYGLESEEEINEEGF
ncbi:hypothetical protein EV360DRAFT_89578 [Lentinula raphanica]|nr:hypothetical protein EV360DRAFT_89578 [Lentinula raphanica]